MIPRPAAARPGRPAPWSHLAPERRRPVLLATVCSALAPKPTAPRPAPPRAVAPLELPGRADARPAAVLCLLFEEEGEAHVVLTRRSRHLPSHAGEVSFPGGRLEPGETALAAALREAEEEVGLRPAAVTVVGELTPLTTQRSPALVRCFVGHFAGPGAQGGGLTPNAEVERVFSVALADLAAPGVFHEELWPVGPARPGLGPSPARVEWRAVPFFDLPEDTVWGATGRLLTELLGLAMGVAGHGAEMEGTLEGS